MYIAGKTLLNLDTEDWGEIFIGCAGGGDSMITLPVQHTAVSADKVDAYTIRISGTHPRPMDLVRMSLVLACPHYNFRSCCWIRVCIAARVSGCQFIWQHDVQAVHAHDGK